MTKRELAVLEAYLDAPYGTEEARDALDAVILMVLNAQVVNKPWRLTA